MSGSHHLNTSPAHTSKQQTSPWLLFGLLAITLLLVVGYVYIERQPRAVSIDQSLQQLNTADYFRGTVSAVSGGGNTAEELAAGKLQILTVRLSTGSAKNTEVVAENHNALLYPGQAVQVNDNVIVTRQTINGAATYFFVDFYRLPSLLWVLVIFIVIAIVLGRSRGITALLALGFSFLILVYVITPQILSGVNPLLVSGIGSGLIAIASIFFAHGLNKNSTLATVATLGVLASSILLVYGVTYSAKLFGLGSEGTTYLQSLSFGGQLNIQGILMAGIIVGMLGVLDDVTVTQVVSVHQMHLLDAQLTPIELWKKGIAIGREHVASLVNTLLLAYAGASFPLFLLFAATQAQPIWLTLNSELVAQEIARSLIGGLGLMLAVPFATALAAFYYGKREQR